MSILTYILGGNVNEKYNVEFSRFQPFNPFVQFV